VIAAGLLILALALVVIYTGPRAFVSPIALVVVAAIGVAALLLQVRFCGGIVVWRLCPHAAIETGCHGVRRGGMLRHQRSIDSAWAAAACQGRRRLAEERIRISVRY
jgi:hypothetical protein